MLYFLSFQDNSQDQISSVTTEKSNEIDEDSASTDFGLKISSIASESKVGGSEVTEQNSINEEDNSETSNNDTTSDKGNSMENSSEIQDLKTFETLSDSKNEDLPILEVNVRKGTVNISVFQKDTSQETNYECGNLL